MTQYYTRCARARVRVAPSLAFTAYSLLPEVANTVNNADEAAGKGLRVAITDKRGQDPETWVEDMRCLKCFQVLD
jgi:hypothetical protein